jgi:hypothetical protein
MSAAPENVSRGESINAPRRCPCGKEDCRPGQRNGYECAKKANKEYRARQIEKQLAAEKLALAGIAARRREEGEAHG